MESPHGYGGWPMQQPNSGAGQDWQLGPDGMPQPISSGSMHSMSIPSSAPSMPGYLGANYNYMSPPPQQQQQQNQQHHQLYPPLPSQYSAASASASSGYPTDTMTINASTFHELQAMYPNATPEALMMAVMPPQPMQAHHHQQSLPQQYAQQGASQLQPPQLYQQQQYPQYEMQHAASAHSLADALSFSTPASATPSSLAATVVTAPTPDPDTKKKTKLRQTKLAFLPRISHVVSKETTPPSLPSAAIADDTSSSNADVVANVDKNSEPGTPPLPPARALATNPSSNGTSTSTFKAASSASSVDSMLWNKAKPLLGRLAVEQKPDTSARELIKILSDFDSDGRFRRPVPTGAEVRKTIVASLQSIALLEKGRGYTESGRKKFFTAWMASPAARHILSSWLRQAVPPKKVTEGVPDLSRRYKETLLPLLNVLECVPMRKAYLTDEAGLGKAITGASLRATDTGARRLAEALKAKWTKIIEAEDSTGASRPAAASSGTTSTAVKRKPAETSNTSEASTKRYKSAASVASSSAGVKAAKPATASASSAAAKPGLSFFGSSTAKKPASAGAGANTRPSGAGTAGRSNAGQDVMNFLGTLSGGVAKGASQVKQEETPSEAQEKKKVKKRVTWKNDKDLVDVRLIEPADYGQDDEQHAALMERGLEGLEHDEGDALRQSFSTMEEQTDWYEPREVIVADAIGGPAGSESVEGLFQLQRNASLEEVTFEERQEPSCPDESRLEQEGTISKLSEQDWPLEHVPEELKGETTLDFGLPEEWNVGDAGDEDGAEVKKEETEGSEGVQANAAAAPSNAPVSSNISELLSKIGPLVGGGPGSTIGSQASAAAASAVAALPKLDQNALQSLLEKTKGGGASADAVNAAVTGATGTSNDLSSLLSSLSSTFKAGPPAGPQSESAGNGSYYPATSRPVESYPGEYQQDYSSGGGGNGGDYYQPQQRPSQYGQGSHYGAPSYASGYGQQGDWEQQQGYGGGNNGGSWQSKLHTKPCKFYAKGNCFRGASCHFRHD